MTLAIPSSSQRLNCNDRRVRKDDAKKQITTKPINTFIALLGWNQGAHPAWQV